MIQRTNDRYVSLGYLVKRIADALTEKNRWWELDDEDDRLRRDLSGALDIHGNNLRRDLSGAFNTVGWEPDGMPSFLSHIEQAIVNDEITPRSTANGLTATDAALVVNHYRNWYLTLADADVLLCKAGLPARYTNHAVAAAGGMFPEEIAFTLSRQPSANKDIEYHLENIQDAFERGELRFYKDDEPQHPDDWITAHDKYVARLTRDIPKVTQLLDTRLYTKPNDVNRWLEQRGVGYRLPVFEVSAQAGDDAMGNPASDWRQQVRDEATRWCRERLADGKPKATNTAVAKEMAVWCRNNEIKTDTGINPDAEYIRRHILNRWNHP